MAKPLKIIIKYYFTQIDIFEYYLIKIQKEGKKTHIHQLRIAVKNLRAMHQLFSVAGVPDEKIKPVETLLNKVFKTSGDLREIQINRQLAKEYISHNTLLVSYLNYTRELLKEQKKVIVKKVSKFQTKAFAEYIHQMNSGLIQISTEDANLRIKEFLNNRSQLIKGLAHATIEDQQIHLIRKYLKEIKTFVSVAKAIQLQIVKGFKTELNHIENELGKWHDIEVFHDSVKAFILLHPLYIETTTDLLETLNTEQQEFKKKLPKLIEPLLLSFDKSLK